jgi:uncharacterized membrane protein
MFGLTNLGAIHTAISLVSLATGIASLFRFGEIRAGHLLGRIYFWSTVLTCLTGFGIFQHGGFGKPHALGVLTLLVLGMVAAARTDRWFGNASRYVEAIGYSTTFFFHLIPGLTETFTRVPVGAPLFNGPDDPTLQKIVGFLFVLLVGGCVLQVRRLRGQQATWRATRVAQ